MLRFVAGSGKSVLVVSIRDDLAAEHGRKYIIVALIIIWHLTAWQTSTMLFATIRPLQRRVCRSAFSTLSQPSSLPLVVTSFDEETKVATLSMNRPPVNSLSMEL